MTDETPIDEPDTAATEAVDEASAERAGEGAAEQASEGLAPADRDLEGELAPEERLLQGWLPEPTPTEGPAPAP